MDINKIRRCVRQFYIRFGDLAFDFGVRKSKMLHRMLRGYGKRMQQHNIDDFSLQHRCNKTNMFILLHRYCNMLHDHATSYNMEVLLCLLLSFERLWNVRDDALTITGTDQNRPEPSRNRPELSRNRPVTDQNQPEPSRYNVVLT